MSVYMKTNVIIILAMTALSLLQSCANQAAPGGGPVDKEPPEVAASSPEHGQTNVDLRAPVSVTFSEWVRLPNLAAVAVYPPLPAGQTVRVAKNRLTVTPNEPLRENTTYRVVIGTALQDLRNNAITEPINIVFSTGAELDSGRLDGAVVPFERLVTIPRVALYRDGDDWADANYFAPPEYMTHTDSAGAFSFTHLRPGLYRVVAFTDQYRIGRLRVGDACFTSTEKSIDVTAEPRTIRLYPASSDTAALARLNERWGPDTTAPKLRSHLPSGRASLKPELQLIWTKPVRITLTAVTAAEVPVAVTNIAAAVAAVAVDTAVTDSAAAPIAADTAGIDTAADPVVADTVDIDTADIDASGADIVDADATAVVDSVAFFFMPGEHSDTTRLVASRRLLPGRAYRISIPAAAVRSINGVAATDSVTVTFRTILADSIAYRLHGGADCLEPNDRRRWIFRPIGRGGGETFTVACEDGTFSFDSIPASRGTLIWFIDDNGDNRPTPGNLAPWRAPERFLILPDTVEAKARWEIEDVRVRGCE
jgi:hypothetical protein